MNTLDLKNIARALGGEVSGGQVKAPGPGHSSADRSMSVKLSDTAPDGFVVNSFAEDDPIKCRDYVREKIGLEPFKPAKKNQRASDDAVAKAMQAAFAAQLQPSANDIVATYDYCEIDGTLLYQVVRLKPKSFRHRRPNGNGGWIWKGSDRRIPYRWPELLQFPDATVFICEGEKDADRVASLNQCATTVASGEWTDDCVKALAGRDCLILEDNDETGRKKATEAATRLYGIAKTVRIVRLPNLPDAGDVSDWLDADPRRADKLVDICFDAPLFEPDDKADTSGKKDEQNKDQEARPPLPFINIAAWDAESVPEQEWAVENRFPIRQAVLFSGEGAAGKSTIYLHLSAAHVLGKDWLGSMPEPGPALFIEAEDDQAVLHRRLAAVAQHYGVTFSELAQAGLKLISLAGQDAVIAVASRSGKIEPTQLFNQLLQAAGDIKPKMIGIASSANVYAGNEIDRSQVQQFMSLLTRLAMVANGTTHLISHPSLTGISTDTGLSGNTQWHNAVRARCYLKSVKPEVGEQPDTDLRELVFKKNNYGPISESIVLRYQNGLFLPAPGTGSLDKLAQEAKADEVFTDLLSRFTRDNRSVSDKPGPSYAPAKFACEEEAKRACLNNRAFEAAMRRLFKAGKIWNEQYGKPSRPHYRLAVKG